MFHPQGPTFSELMEQAWSSTRQGYDLLAPKFDFTPFRTRDDMLDVVAAQIGPPGSISAALDLCCGTGAGVRMLRPLARDVVVGVDWSPGMLDEARRRLADAPGTSAVELVLKDVLELADGDVPGGLDGRFDVVTSFGAFGHVLHDDQPAFGAVIARALKPGGRFVFVSADPPPVISRAWVLSRGFNAAMHVRNALKSPPFHMYYLNFLIPRARQVLEPLGFRIEVRDVFPPPFSRFRVVVATRGPRG